MKIWNPATSRCTTTLEGPDSLVLAISWSRDAKWIVPRSNDGVVMIWNSDSEQCTSTLEGHSGAVTSSSWSPDGSQIAPASRD
ncbi:hypothetical protein PDIP_10350 [Penicillium digitatum Pd1]|uniref:Uncharacterized protein n=1 Tax=Penicillium digitatum (strain Pd1 / CECT 20795) TaxID=1170230 RepID=K9H7L7_PEND1|nr:hypothetical protein PDIP_10350 [Penicillium digitatum Pd1]EKV21081.1 hypothetical protein PDIP_10350 [Penicillium digitatum Pd1]